MVLVKVAVVCKCMVWYGLAQGPVGEWVSEWVGK